jgi:hypothetical protein
MMSTLKDILVSGVGKVASIPQKVASWSQKTQIIVAAGTAGALMIASIGGVAIYQHNNQQPVTDTVAEAELETQAEEVVMMTETEIPEVVTLAEIREIPSFVSCTVSGDSVEKDLTLYIKGTDKKKISGEKFTVKLIDPDDKSKLSSAISAIEDIDDQIENLKEDDTEESDDSVSIASTTGDGVLTRGSDEEAELVYISSVTGEAVTAKEELLCAKEEAIDAYAQVLASLDGETYTDSDSDGMIYIESIEDGDYLACLVPDSNYDPTNYAVKVTVKETLEYEVIENIQDKVVSEAAAGDTNERHDDIQVENVAKDTVAWVDSKVEEGTPKYKTAKAAPLSASAGGDLNTTTVKKKVSDTQQPSTGTQSTESQTTSSQPTQTTQPTESQTTSSQPTQTTETTSQTTETTGQSTETGTTTPPAESTPAPSSDDSQSESVDGTQASIVPVRLYLSKSK